MCLPGAPCLQMYEVLTVSTVLGRQLRALAILILWLRTQIYSFNNGHIARNLLIWGRKS